MSRHVVNGNPGDGWYCYECPFFTRDVEEAAKHDGEYLLASELDADQYDAEFAKKQSAIKMLLAHGWEISEDQTEARLYSEEWSDIQAAIESTEWWIKENSK